MTTIYGFQRGETISVMLEAVGATDADLAFVQSVAAVLKPASAGRAVPPRDTPAAATFSVAQHGGDVGQGVAAGWTLTLSAETSDTLEPGSYVTNASLTLVGGTVVKTEPLFIRIDPST
jgi:hypothetical protein